jgi:hypothetical protein
MPCQANISVRLLCIGAQFPVLLAAFISETKGQGYLLMTKLIYHEANSLPHAEYGYHAVCSDYTPAPKIIHIYFPYLIDSIKLIDRPVSI